MAKNNNRKFSRMELLRMGKVVQINQIFAIDARYNILSSLEFTRLNEWLLSLWEDYSTPIYLQGDPIHF